jgi:Amt family ammonium transporter
MRRALLVIAAMTVASPARAAVASIDKGDTAWMLVATLLVTMMVLPGLGLFYGGLVRAKNMLSILTQVLGVTAVAILAWFGWGYSLAFSGDGVLVGNFAKAFLIGIGPSSQAATFTAGVAIPELLYVAFQMIFAAVTAAIILGALAERMRFSAILLFTLLWISLVYAPLAHMVWAAGGFIFRMGAIDFAGGTVVHINAGIAGLVGVLFAGPRIGFLKEAMQPHSLTLTLTGTGLLWVGWFGFNAGSALEANGSAAIAMMNTFIAPAAGVLAWMGIEKFYSNKASALGGASGALAGLVAITPAAGTSGFAGGAILGALAALACYGFVGSLKFRLKFDDSLDAFGIHGIAGIVGSLGTAIVSAPALGGFAADGYAIVRQLGIQSAAVAVAIAWSAVGSVLCFALVRRLVGLRVDRDSEREGLDLTEHGERAYTFY